MTEATANPRAQFDASAPSHIPAHLIPTTATQLLRAMLAEADIVERANGLAFLLVAVTQRTLDRLARFEAHTEDMEPDEEGSELDNGEDDELHGPNGEGDDLDRGERGDEEAGEPDHENGPSLVPTVGADSTHWNGGVNLDREDDRTGGLHGATPDAVRARYVKHQPSLYAKPTVAVAGKVVPLRAALREVRR